MQYTFIDYKIGINFNKNKTLHNFHFFIKWNRPKYFENKWNRREIKFLNYYL